MGIVLFCMVAGRVPFRGETVFMTYEMIRSEESVFSYYYPLVYMTLKLSSPPLPLVPFKQCLLSGGSARGPDEPPSFDPEETAR